MKKLLVIPLLLGFTSAVNAESYWLLVSQTGGGLVKVEMDNMKSCEIESNKIEKAKPFAPKLVFTYCMKGK